MHMMQDLGQYNPIPKRNSQTKIPSCLSEDHSASIENAEIWLEDGIGEKDEAVG